MAKKQIELVVSSGQCETNAMYVTIVCTGWNGFRRRVRQLEKEYGVEGDSFAGFVRARVALADDRDVWGKCQIIGGRWCDPWRDWFDVESDRYPGMSDYFPEAADCDW